MAFDCARLQACVDFILQVTIHTEVTVRAVGDKMAARWMVRRLLKVESCAILLYALVGLTEDWIQRLAVHLHVVEPAEVRTHSILHALDWVL